MSPSMDTPQEVGSPAHLLPAPGGVLETPGVFCPSGTFSEPFDRLSAFAELRDSFSEFPTMLALKETQTILPKHQALSTAAQLQWSLSQTMSRSGGAR